MHHVEPVKTELMKINKFIFLNFQKANFRLSFTMNSCTFKYCFENKFKNILKLVQFVTKMSSILTKCFDYMAEKQKNESNLLKNINKNKN